MEQNIFKTFKIIIKGKVFWIRAKEVSGWIPDFLDEDEEDEEKDESDEDLLDNEFDGKIKKFCNPIKKPKNDNKEEESSRATLKYPPGFTSNNVLRTKDVQDVDDVVEVKENTQKSQFRRSVGPQTGGSILQVMEDLVVFYVHEILGCSINTTRRFQIILLLFKVSGLQMLKSILSYQFMLLKKLLRRMLWSYLYHMIDRWDGESILIGDFNEVRHKEERFGSIFNNHNAIVFNSFISSSGLVEVLLGGCAFTWCHESGSKMSKLDRFLISEEKKVDQELLNKRMNVINSIHVLKKLEAMEIAQKAKINWSIEGDENSKNFHGILNKKRNQHAIRGILSEGNWIEDPNSVKNAFFSHFKERFDSPCPSRLMLEGQFPNKLRADQSIDLESNASGLRMNLQKSKLMGIFVEDEIVSRAESKMGCCTLTTPFLYLGVKFSGSMSCIKAWDEIEAKLHSRLSKWKMKTLSSGGRLTLLKSVLGSSPIYCMSIYKVPSKVLKCLVDTRRNFFIGADVKEKNMSWFKWSRVLASKEKGGLGVSSFFALNKALLFKWMWRFFNYKDALWSRFVRAVHGNNGCIETHSRVSYSSTWLSIVNEVNKMRNKGIDLLKYMKIQVCNGLNSKFWEDVWMGMASSTRILKPHFLEFVADKMAHNDTAFSLRRQPRDGVEMEQFRALSIFIEGVLLHDLVDRWKWTLEGSGKFSVAISSKHKELLEGIYYAMWWQISLMQFSGFYAVQRVCIHMHDPREPHLSAFKRILRYVLGTLNYGLQLFSSSTTYLVAYSDADWTGCPTTRRSTFGHCVFLGKNLLSWSSKRHPTLSRSSVEAEYRGVANVVDETYLVAYSDADWAGCPNTRRSTFGYCVFLGKNLLSWSSKRYPTLSRSSAEAEYRGVANRTKHIEIDIHFVRDLVATGQVRVLHVPSRYQFVDIFTKGLSSALFEEFHTSLSIWCPPAPTAREC
uniref:RNA-directed DNA polymerase, eukaryota, reverse transcriptase zinc-binding domain protein n=1 Tax=Tanacetum cinerariifolium TaxID=118510 RepID=A0A6L2MSK2_TANCI|nr:RNA-directed DNA polymerase, eukaryota, reverse transcriptase zinc-binding domain protein [Tanacetum cinerariifolium]